MEKIEMTLLNLDTASQLNLTADDFVGQGVGILGVTGSGKSNTVRVLATEIAPTIPLTIVDIKGEYRDLSARLQMLVVGKHPDDDVFASPDHAAALARFAVENRLSVILNMRRWHKDEREEFLLAYCETLFQLVTIHLPYILVVEEARAVIPQSAAITPLMDLLIEMTRMGRMDGLSLWVVNQRAATIHKDVLTQLPISFFHRTTFPQDKKVYADTLPVESKELKMTVPQLGDGQAYVMVKSRAGIYQIRRDVHETPSAVLTPTGHLGRADLLEELKVALSATAPIDENSPAGLRLLVRQQAQRIEELERCLAAEQNKLYVMAEERDAYINIANSHKGHLDDLRKRPGQVDTINLLPEQIELPVFQSDISDSNPYVSPRALELRVKRQSDAFDKFLSVVRRQSQPHRNILKLLLGHDGQYLTISQIARMLAYSESTISGNPPLDFIQLGLIGRQKQAGKYRYAATAEATLAERYPNLDTAELIDQLMEKL